MQQPSRQNPARRRGSSAYPAAKREQVDKRVQYGQECYLTLVCVMLAAQTWLLGTSMLIPNTAQSSWWVLGLSLPGGALCWLPVSLLMKRAQSGGLLGAIREAWGKVGGGAVSILLCFSLYVSGLLCVESVVEICQQFVLPEISSSFVVLSLAVMLLLCLLRSGTLGVSRLAFSLRMACLFLLGGCFVVQLQNAEISNLYPLAGYGLLHDMKYAVAAGAGLCGVFVLGLLPTAAEGSPKPTFLKGFSPMLVALASAMVLLFALNLTYPYESMGELSTWASRMIASAEYMARFSAFRMIYILFQVMALLVAVLGCLSFGAHILAQTIARFPERMWSAGLLLSLIGAALYLPTPLKNAYGMVMALQLPYILLLLWLTLLLHRLRCAKQKTPHPNAASQ